MNKHSGSNRRACQDGTEMTHQADVQLRETRQAPPDDFNLERSWLAFWWEDSATRIKYQLDGARPPRGLLMITGQATAQDRRITSLQSDEFRQGAALRSVSE